MATIKEDYISFETAKLIKEKGFDIPCDYAYNNKACYFEIDRSNFDEVYCFRPSLAMAMKWLREVYHIAIVVAPSMFWGRYNISIYKKGNDYPFGFDGDSLIPSYEEACEAAIKYSLENLI